MRQRGGQFSEGDFGCVVHPGLSTTINPQLVVAKIFKDPINKAREEYINELIALHFINDFIVKPVQDIINPQANPEIRQCRMGQDQHQITDAEIMRFSILYQYLGRTYRDIFARGDPSMMIAEMRALIILTLKVIDMNTRGFSHNDISEANITYKDGNAYLIDIGSFTYRPGEHLYRDLSDLLNILYRHCRNINESYRIRLQRFTAISIRDTHIQDISALLLELEKVISTTGATATRLSPIHNVNIERGANAGGMRKRVNKTKYKTRVRKASKKRTHISRR
jgi:hypothetical protein